MNRILLAYCHDNAPLAHYLDHKLSRIGIPFEHVTEQPDAPVGTFTEQLRSNEEPVLLLVTDNLLKNRHCMVGLLPVLQQLVRQDRVLVVVADGVDVDGMVVPTHIDRMVNALLYMNYWQNTWLDLSNAHQQATAEEKELLDEELDQVRNIANQMGDLISAMRDAGYSTEEQLESHDFVLFFQKFGLSDWHGQYRRLAALDHEVAGAPESIAPAAMVEIPVVSGPLAPTPAEPLNDLPSEPEEELPIDFDEEEEDLEPEMLPSNQDPGETNLAWAGETAESDLPIDRNPEIETTIRDAWFWLERGHVERGIDLFQLALEEHPGHEGLQQEYTLALEKYGAGFVEEPVKSPAPPVQEPKTELPTEEPLVEEEPEPVTVEFLSPEEPETNLTETGEAKSYDLMGEMAAEKGDYLFAKYCWDRSAELDPQYPDIYRKLGLMTSEHLRDYRETAVHYLQKALEANPNDAEVHFALAKTSLQSGDQAQAGSWYQRAVSLQPRLRTEEYDRLFSPEAESGLEPEVDLAEPMPTEPVAEQAPVARPREVLTVLITGATSGIGRATAELFAQAGHRLILTGRRIERLVLLKTQLETESQSDVLMLPFDVRDPGAVSAALNNLPEGWQNVDILINNAGLAKGLDPIQEGNLDHWETMIDTNLKGLLYVTRAISPGMVERRRGHIVNISSSAGKEVYVNGNVYCATKFAVDALTRAMRLDLYQHNIRVSQVSPGHVEDTEFALNRFDGDQERAARIYDDFQPLRPEDVADAIYYMVTRPAHVNVQDMVLFCTQQASASAVDRSGRGESEV